MQKVLLKLSGEALASSTETLDPELLNHLAEEIEPLVKREVGIAIVCGAGNLFRGKTLSRDNLFDRCGADQIGMLGTVINSLAINAVLLKRGIKARTMSAAGIEGVVERYQISRARSAIKQGEVVILAGGTGNPFFSTDSAGALRALELEMDYFIKATKVDGVYTKDPQLHSDAVKYTTLTYRQAIQEKLAVMDLTALTLCEENHLPIYVYNFFAKGALASFIQGKRCGTFIG